MTRRFANLISIFSTGALLVSVAVGQPPANLQDSGSGRPNERDGGFRGPGGPGGMGAPDRKILADYDANKDGWLNTEEREKAKLFLKENPTPRGFGPPRPFGPPEGGGPPNGAGRPEDSAIPPRGGRPEGFGPPDGFRPPGGFPGGPGGPGRNRPAPKKGQMISTDSVQPFETSLYDAGTLRTIFIDFETAEWESELEIFHGTDVEVPAKVTVDGKTLPNCGIHFRGMSSYHMVSTGYKRSLNVSVDLVDKEQRLLGYKTLNLLNSNGDSSMLSSVLYSKIASQFLPTPKANLVRVVINGEDWGIYANVQQFNKDFLKENYPSAEGTRWKVSGSPMGGGGLEYRGEDPKLYQHPYEMKSNDSEAVVKLINLCRVLNETPTEDLPSALEPIVDIDGLLWFLALDNSLINSDGYWIRASDYSIFLDRENKFHFIAHDMNEAFRKPGGPGMDGRRGGGPGGRGGRPGAIPPTGPRDNARPENDPAPNRPEPPIAGDRAENTPPARGETARESGRPGRQPVQIKGVELDPLFGLDDPSKPLRSKILQVPKYREQYLQNVRRIADESLSWENLGPFVKSQVELIDDIVSEETRGLSNYKEFLATVDDQAPAADNQAGEQGGPGGHAAMNIREFVDARREYLLKVTDKK